MKRERGFTLIEVLISLAVLGVIAIAFLGGLTTASKGLSITDERQTGQNLAETQMEFIRQQGYDGDTNHNPPQYSKLPAGEIPNGYDIEIEAIRLDPDGDGLGDDDNAQLIRINVIHGSKDVLTLEDYKVKR